MCVGDHLRSARGANFDGPSWLSLTGNFNCRQPGVLIVADLQEPPSLISLMLAPLRILFATATLLIPPYLVHKLGKLSPDVEPLLAREVDSEEQEQTASAQIESPPDDAI